MADFPMKWFPSTYPTAVLLCVLCSICNLISVVAYPGFIFHLSAYLHRWAALIWKLLLWPVWWLCYWKLVMLLITSASSRLIFPDQEYEVLSKKQETHWMLYFYVTLS